MMDLAAFDRRPVIVAIAGPNGAGKTTFYRAHLAASGLRYVNADVLAAELALAPYAAARLADSIRRELVARRESFIFETVFSDPVGEKVDFLTSAAAAGYEVVLCYIGLDSVETSVARVAMRASQGGHDVPDEKLTTRFARTLANLARAIVSLPHVLVFDNSDLSRTFRHVATFEQGLLQQQADSMPRWLQALLG